jgi:alkanesulfonate monooxygenase SsuD/methylene tetrahydromethanopterin reductase-like flavin-dependent oxidoreductase (luciferase family)
VASDVAGRVAKSAEEQGYASFWVNGSPPGAALESLRAAADSTSLSLGVGVLPLTKISAIDIVSQVREFKLPEDRVYLGVGSSRIPGALAEVRAAVDVIRAETDVTVVTAAVGPKMTELAGEISDVVLFTWWTASEVERSRSYLEAGADRGDRPTPLVASYIRCALVPRAAEAVAERAAAYAAIPRYAKAFARAGINAADTVVTGSSAVDLAPGIAREEEVLDLSIIRAITADESYSSFEPLIAAAAPSSD